MFSYLLETFNLHKRRSALSIICQEMGWTEHEALQVIKEDEQLAEYYRRLLRFSGVMFP